MTRDEFFEKLRSESDTNKAFILELLKLRGFLFEEESDKLLISDNSHDHDSNYLSDLFGKYNLGKINKRVITINDTDPTRFIQSEFRENNQIGIESTFMRSDWSYFKRRKHGKKVAVAWLEPFIARYIKSISYCCVLTAGSCDGNHPGKDKMCIMTEGEGSIPWHRLICEKCLFERFDINWKKNCTEIEFSTETKYDTYYAVNKAAAFLYANRIEIRDIKDTAFNDISKSIPDGASSEEIEREFIRRASVLFDSSTLQ